MAFETIRVEERDAVAFVTAHRPEKLNALNDRLVEELLEAFEWARRTASIRAVVLTGAGDKAFMAGADIAVLAACDPIAARANALRGQRLTDLIEMLGKPVIAAINGYALGGGCEIALACTVRIASENAKLGQPEVKLGLITGYGGSQRLSRIVGRGRALELLLTGDSIDAREAHRIGLVNRVTSRESLLAEAESLARKMLAAGPLAVAYTLEAVHRGLEGGQAEGMMLEANLFGLCFATQDMREGTRAFLEKRAPRFAGR